MEALVKNLLAAYKTSIDKLDWMTPATKKQAQAKLAKFTYKIGYPNKWRDYSALVIAKDDLVGNVIRSRQFDYNKELNKLGKPIDRDEWGMTPQTVNAYYNPEMNEIVFPAAILQAPFFNAGCG
jgi:predicted metalloendopeptidase